MAQAPVFYTRQHGWDTTSTDYHVHVSTMERMPSILPDVPRYPNVHRAFNNKTIHEDEFEVTHQESMQKQRQPPTTHGKKVHLVEQVQIIPREKNEVIFEENIDSETDGFLQRKHKTFELCKWKTFKLL
ncbi:uncharacterized protein LOC8278283 [Ricinus communis]|uniref:uncharacterized protein LOC8278283 n=1 Tax=Ricinus communis TaxID=3988 RepID=UPI00077259D5|nr:uncharacterized protein LOC8278283 [Ricinus communis]|eukprot:XP_015578861.1 uncharacterized protein LOC8278283 [Ricinus communis]